MYLNVYALPNEVLLEKALIYLPTKLESWRGSQSTWIDMDNIIPNLDYSLSRKYRNNKNEQVSLFIGYFASQDKENRLVSYRDHILYDNCSSMTASAAHVG